MAKLRQLMLPKVSGVARKKKLRKTPQPQVDEFRQIKQFEIFHRPFDLHFRGILSKWLNYLQSERNLKTKEILSPVQYKVVNLYFYPQSKDERWLNQEEVLTQVDINNKKKLRQTLISALVRIWKKSK